MPIQITSDTPLAEITPEVIEALLQHNVDEDVYFDFKEGVQGQDAKEKHRIRKALVSFANTFGGFLFFGILDKADQQGKSGLERVCGIDNPRELGPLITSKYLDKGYCVPIIDFEGPSVVPVNGRPVAVIKVLRTEKSPHGIKSSPESALEFWDRGSGKVRALEYADLAREFDRRREERGWLIALSLDLQGVIATARGNVNLQNPSTNIATKFDSIVERHVGDLLRVLGGDAVLMRQLIPLRTNLIAVDDQRDFILAKCVLPLSNLAQIVVDGNADIGKRSQVIEGQALSLLAYLLSMYPFLRDHVALQSQRISS